MRGGDLVWRQSLRRRQFGRKIGYHCIGAGQKPIKHCLSVWRFKIKLDRFFIGIEIVEQRAAAIGERTLPSQGAAAQGLYLNYIRAKIRQQLGGILAGSPARDLDNRQARQSRHAVISTSRLITSATASPQRPVAAAASPYNGQSRARNGARGFPDNRQA